MTAESTFFHPTDASDDIRAAINRVFHEILDSPDGLDARAAQLRGSADSTLDESVFSAFGGLAALELFLGSADSLVARAARLRTAQAARAAAEARRPTAEPWGKF